MLNPQSPLPLYHQLADILLARIRSGEYAPGTKIPSENALAASYGIGRPTARQAIDLLVKKRTVERKRGSGTFVKEPEKEVDLFSLAGTTSAFNGSGLSVSTQMLIPTRLARVEQDPDNPFSEKDAYFFSRLTKVEGKPVLIEDIYLHPELFSGIDRLDLSGRSLSRVVIENYYMKPDGGKQNFSIAYPARERARLLSLPEKDPVLSVKRFLNFPLAENAIYSELYCRTDRFVFSQVIGGIPDE